MAFRLSSRLMRTLCLAALLPLLVHSQSAGDLSFDANSNTISSYDCMDPSNREGTHIVRRGQMTTVCLYVGPAGDWNRNLEYKRFSFNLKADEFSSYQIPGSFSALGKASGSTNITGSHIFAASQSSLSFLRRYVDIPLRRIYPFLTAIIDVDKGNVLGITWDDACVFCEMSECISNTYNFDGSVATAEQAKQPLDGCYLTQEECLGFEMSGSALCDLKLYVVWTGTDADGNALLSSDSRFSMFPPNRIEESVTGAYDKMLEDLKKLKDTITSQRH